MRWLTTFFLAVFALGLLGCGIAKDERPAHSPAVFRGGGGLPPPREARGEVGFAGEDQEAADTSVTVSSPSAKEQAVTKAPDAQPTPATKAPPGPSFVPGASHITDLIIYTATITMAVYQVEPGLDAVERIARETGGYLAQRSDKQITIRVPRARFDDALRRVQASGDVVHRDVSAEDVTDQYVELETRLKNARAMRDRLEQLLARAAVKEAVEIEKELGRVTGDIESMEGKLKVLKDKISYSTITVSFEPRGASAVRDVPLRLPFGWLTGLGLPRLLSLGEGS